MTHEQRPALSIVVPAFNEAARLPATLQAIDAWIAGTALTTEVIVANDGSHDATLQLARAHTFANATYRVLDLAHRGKANAVRQGVLAATGRVILFTDADLSTPIAYAGRLIEALDTGADVAIGSREGVGATRVGEPGYRHLMGRVFNALVRALAVPGVNDTQCGFKAFRGDVARDIFSRVVVHVDRGDVSGPRVTGFDVEVLYIARRRGYTIVEVPVYWRHAAGSKVRPWADSFRMFADVVRVRWAASRRRYD